MQFSQDLAFGYLYLLSVQDISLQIPQIAVSLFDTLSPFSPRKFKSLMVASLTSTLASPDNKRSSTYCIISIPGGGGKVCNTVSKAHPNKLGDSVKPCGNFVHLSCCLLPVCVSSHSKAKIFWLFSANGQAPKASFRSTTLNH